MSITEYMNRTAWDGREPQVIPYAQGIRNLFTSNAKWPEKIYSYDDCTTTDSHPTFEQAKAVCDALMHRGFGGEREVFPIRVWVQDKEGNTLYEVWRN